MAKVLGSWSFHQMPSQCNLVFIIQPYFSLPKQLTYQVKHSTGGFYYGASACPIFRLNKLLLMTRLCDLQVNWMPTFHLLPDPFKQALKGELVERTEHPLLYVINSVQEIFPVFKTKHIFVAINTFCRKYIVPERKNASEKATHTIFPSQRNTSLLNTQN